MGERDDGRWAASEAAIIVPRQNGKGDVLLGKALHSMYLSPAKLILWSAHEFKTAREMFLRVQETIDGCDALRRLVKRVRTSHGEEGIELNDGSRLGFVARSRGSGRGFSPDELLLDEAFALTDEQMAAMMPAISARDNPFIAYASSHPLPTSTVLRRICKRGRSGGRGLVYIEYSADPDLATDDPEAWAQANPGYPYRINDDSIERERGAMDEHDFKRERLGIVVLDDEEESVVDKEVWQSIADPDGQVRDPVAFALDITPDRSAAAIGAVGFREDGRRGGEVADHRNGTKWLVNRIVEMCEKWRPCAVGLDANSAAVSLIPELEKRGIKSNPGPGETLLVVVGGSQMTQACGGWHDAVTNDQWRHRDQAPLNAALAGARKREMGDGGWKWSRKDSSIDISPLVAVTIADYLLQTHGEVEESPEPWFAFA